MLLGTRAFSIFSVFEMNGVLASPGASSRKWCVGLNIDEAVLRGFAGLALAVVAWDLKNESAVKVL